MTGIAKRKAKKEAATKAKEAGKVVENLVPKMEEEVKEEAPVVEESQRSLLLPQWKKRSQWKSLSHLPQRSLSRRRLAEDAPVDPAIEDLASVKSDEQLKSEIDEMKKDLYGKEEETREEAPSTFSSFGQAMLCGCGA